MKKVSKKLKSVSLLIAALSMVLLSFTSPKGGEGFEIYVNNKLLLQQFGKEMNTVKTVSIDESLADVQLTVKYYHCGQAGKNRVLTITDAENKLLKEWKFADGQQNNTSMCCGVKEILSLKTKNTGKLNLYYSSSLLPYGRLLASIVINKEIRTAKW